MIFEALIITIVGHWLDLDDLVRLHSASCTKVHEAILGFMQSALFMKLYELKINRILLKRALNSLSRLKWSRIRNVHPSDMSLWLQYPETVSEICNDESGSFDFIEEVCYVCDDAFPIMEDFISMMTQKFPNIKELSFASYPRDQPEGSDISSLLSGIPKLYPSLPLRSITFRIPWRQALTAQQVILLSDICHIAGETLTNISLPDINISLALLEIASLCCPNLTSLFPGSFLDVSVTFSNYLAVCKRLPRLQKLDIGHCCFIMTDNDFELLLGCLPHLESVKVKINTSCSRRRQVTAASLLAAVKLLPELSRVSLAGLGYYRSINKTTVNQETRTKNVCRLELNLVDDEDISGYHVFTFLQAIPPLTEICILRDFTLANAKLLASQLSLVNFSHLFELAVEEEVCLAVSHLLHALTNLKKILVICFIATQTQTTSFIEERRADALIRALCEHCKQVTNVAFEGLKLEPVTDEYVELLCTSLPNLSYLQINITGQVPQLTKKSLTSMARNGKVWEHVNIDLNCHLSVRDLAEAIDEQGLMIKEIQYEVEGKKYKLRRNIIKACELMGV